jgi:TRAP-type mannitol/chloroaromatic compound transport system substrate-binding protein
MKRRQMVAGLGAAALAGVGCTRPGESGGAGAGAQPRKTFKWKMVTTWPPDFPGLGTGATEVARTIERCSGGRISIKVYGGGELVPPFETFDAVSSGTAELGHAGAYYWKGKLEASPFFATVPFGMNAQEMNGWLYHGGGWELWKEAYAPFGILPIPAGNTGVQMGGWFNREIRSAADLKGLKMRIPGLGGEVFRRAGGTPVALAGAEVFTALQTGVVDAAEWVGPYNDLAFSLHKAAKYYYYPGWHEPGATLECLVNKRAWDALPEDLQAIVLAACASVNDRMLAEFTARSAQALDELVNVHKVQVRAFPADVIAGLKRLTAEVMAETAARDPLFRRVHDSYMEFYGRVRGWTRISEQAWLQAR